MCCGIFLTANPTILRKTFHAAMDCMPSRDAALDPYMTTAQWSRRFLGLRLYVALATAGWQVEKAVFLARDLASQLAAAGWTSMNDSPMAVLCQRPPPGAALAAHIADAVVQDGGAWVSCVDFEGENVIRACITSGETTADDIAEVAALLNRCAWTGKTQPGSETGSTTTPSL